MTPERWQQVKEVLAEVLEIAPSERRAFLDKIGGDESLRSEVERLIESADRMGESFIEQPLTLRLKGDPPPEKQRMGPYQVEREIGRGGMGTVFLAARADAEYEQRVAIKLLKPGMDSEEIVSRFRSERQILANLIHPNIARLLDGGTTPDGRPYLVMEYVEAGEPIDRYCDHRKLTTRQRLQLFREVASAVHFAHQNLVVHRDLKPGNILVTADGVPKLLDFGIAKLLAPSDLKTPFTLVHSRGPMTPHYASPEQLAGQPITTASDVYSLGLLLYELLTGHSAYRVDSTTPEERLRLIKEGDPAKPSVAVGRTTEVRLADGSTQTRTPESVSTLREGEPGKLRRCLVGDLDNIVLVALSSDTDRRYPSAEQLSQDILRHLEGFPVQARNATLPYRLGKFVRRHRLGVAMAATLSLLVLGFAVTMMYQRNQIAWQAEEIALQLGRAEDVKAFLVDVFRVPDPDRAKGRTITAREILEQASRKLEEDLEAQPETRAELMDTMGLVYRNLGLHDEARRQLTQALEVRKTVLGLDHPLVAVSRNHLANLLRTLGDDAAAEPLLREALAILRKEHGRKHPQLASGINNLAALLEEKGEFQEAEALYREALAMKRQLGEEHREAVATGANNLGKLLRRTGDYRAGEPLLREALEIWRDLYGPVHSRVSTAQMNLAVLLEHRGNPQEAEELYGKALAMRREIYPPDHPALATALGNLARFRQGQEQPEKADAHYREALDILYAKFGRGHPTSGTLQRNLATLRLAMDEPQSAERLARQALMTFQASKPPGHWRIADAESVLGGCLTALGRYDEAEPYVLESYPTLEAKTGAGESYTAEARRRIVELYDASGRPEKAHKWRQE